MRVTYIRGKTGLGSLSRGFEERSMEGFISDVNCRSVKNYMYCDDY